MCYLNVCDNFKTISYKIIVTTNFIELTLVPPPVNVFDIALVFVLMVLIGVVDVDVNCNVKYNFWPLLQLVGVFSLLGVYLAFAGHHPAITL